MSKPQNPNDPDSLSLKGVGTSPSGPRPDFSNVRSDVRSTEAEAKKPDFSNVQSSVRSTEEITSAPNAEYTVQRGDTVQSLARRMAFTNAQEARFRVLNGLGANDTLTPGQKVKIVIRTSS